jgi:hypothetical protein
MEKINKKNFMKLLTFPAIQQCIRTQNRLLLQCLDVWAFVFNLSAYDCVYERPAVTHKSTVLIVSSIQVKNKFIPCFMVHQPIVICCFIGSLKFTSVQLMLQVKQP